MLVNTQCNVYQLARLKKRNFYHLRADFNRVARTEFIKINGQITETCCEMTANFCRKCIKKGEVYFRCLLVPQPTWLENELGAHFCPAPCCSNSLILKEVKDCPNTLGTQPVWRVANEQWFIVSTKFHPELAFANQMELIGNGVIGALE